MVKISVIIPIYNMERYLRECLDSVLSQTLKDIEIICIDDGSTDRSYDILQEYSEKHGNVIILQQENQGAGLARNKGIGQAEGKYLCFLDPDDYYAQNKALEYLYTAAEKNHALICGGNILAVTDDGKKRRMGNWFSEYRMISFQDYENIFYHTRYIFRSDFIKNRNIIFPQYRRYQDPPFFLKALVHAQKVYTISETIYAYRKVKKKSQYALRDAVDVLCGMLDCFRMARENGLIKLYENYLKGALCENLPVYCQYARCGQKEIWELIDGINRISMEWQGETAGILCNQESLEAYIVSLKAKRDDMIAKCKTAREIVIYGAGEAGKFFLEKYGDQCKHIVGFAVSEPDTNGTFVEGYAVKEIEAYNKEALIIVAASKRHADEILQNLERKQFYNISYIEYAVLRFLDGL